MSRLAKKPIILPAKTEISFDGTIVTIKGPLGSLSRSIRPVISVQINGSEVSVSPKSNSLEAKALVGTTVAHIKNMISGVHKAYEKKLVIEGIGYKADIKGKDLVLAVGFSHPVSIPIPTELKVTSEKNTVSVSGMDIEKVGQFAAQVRATKKPEPYLGKGIRYSDEVIRRKQGKKAA
jgi:large subunit ribosomal protein L6